MADIKKFLNQEGVSTLWGRVAEELTLVDNKAKANAEAIDAVKERMTAAEGKIDALEKGTYDDTEVRNLISGNTAAIGTNTAAIALLNSDAETTGSVAQIAKKAAVDEVAAVVAGADAKYDTLKEIADFLLTDISGAGGLISDVTALEAKLEGVESTVVAKIADAINAALKVEGVDKYALASDLTSLATRVKALEDAGYQNASQVGSAIDAKIAALKLAESYDTKGSASAAETAAKAHADGLNTAMNTRVAALEAIDHGKILTDAKAYTDTEIAKIQALTEAEIKSACTAVITA